MPALALVTFYKLPKSLNAGLNLDLKGTIPCLAESSKNGECSRPAWLKSALCSDLLRCDLFSRHTIFPDFHNARCWPGLNNEAVTSTQCHLHTFKEQCSCWGSSLSKEQRQTLDFITPWISLLLGADKMQISEYNDAKCKFTISP